MRTLTVRHITPVVFVALLLTSCSNPEGEFKKAEQANTEQAYNQFIQKHPDSPLVAQAEAQIDSLTFKAAQSANTVATWEAFLQKYPQSTNAAVAHEVLAQLVFQQAATSNSVVAFEGVVKRFADTAAAKEAAKHIEELDYHSATNVNDIAAYEVFVTRHQQGQFTDEIKNRLEVKCEERDWNNSIMSNTVDGYCEFNKRHPASSLVLVYEATILKAPLPTFFLTDSFAPEDRSKVAGSCNAYNGGFGIAQQPSGTTNLTTCPICLRDAINWGLVFEYDAGGMVLPGEIMSGEGGASGGRDDKGYYYNVGATAMMGLAPPKTILGRRTSLFKQNDNLVSLVAKAVALYEQGGYRIISVSIHSKQ